MNYTCAKCDPTEPHPDVDFCPKCDKQSARIAELEGALAESLKALDMAHARLDRVLTVGDWPDMRLHVAVVHSAAFNARRVLSEGDEPLTCSMCGHSCPTDKPCRTCGGDPMAHGDTLCAKCAEVTP